MTPGGPDRGSRRVDAALSAAWLLAAGGLAAVILSDPDGWALVLAVALMPGLSL